MKKTTPVRGCKDYLPNEAVLREEVRQIILSNYARHGFSLVKTPILENLDMLLGSDGGDNVKLMFKTIKRGDKLDLSKTGLTEKDITEEGLRYDLTVPIARYFAEYKDKLTFPFKSIQIDDVFRAERPQRGRYRQFTQCDVDIFGDSSINADIEVILTVADTLDKLGFEDVVIKINDRKILNNVLYQCGFDDTNLSSALVSIDKYDKIGMEGIRKELTDKLIEKSVIDKMEDAISSLKKNGLKVATKFGAKAEDVFSLSEIIAQTEKALFAFGIKDAELEFDPILTRGQGYYTGTVFEAYADGMSGAISGGGRYDKMIEKLVGITIPAVGFSIGFERIAILLLERGKKFSNNEKVALFYGSEDSFVEILKAKQKYMKKFNVTLFARPKNMKTTIDKLTINGYTGFINYPTDEIKKI